MIEHTKARPDRWIIPAAAVFAALASALLGPGILERQRDDELRGRIAGIMAEGAFTPVYQPIVAPDSGAIVGYEALTRFAVDDARRGLLQFPPHRGAGTRLREARHRDRALDRTRPGATGLLGRHGPLRDRDGGQLIAEGIETVDEHDTLRSLAVDLGQGYLIGRPSSSGAGTLSR